MGDVQSTGSVYVRADVQKTDAAKSLNREGTQIGLGKRTTRLVLDSDDSKFNISLKQEKSSSFISRGYNLGTSVLRRGGSLITRSSPQEVSYVPLKIIDSNEKVRVVSVNVDELADRLHLKKEVILERAQVEGGLETLINQQKEKLASVSKAVDQFGGLKNEKAGISSKKMMKAATQAFESLSKDTHNFTVGKNKEKFVAHLNKNTNTLHLHKIEGQIAKTGFGIIQRAIELNSETSLVIKESYRDPRAQEDLKNEKEMLSTLKHPAIQEEPHVLLTGKGAHLLIVRFCEKGSLEGTVAKQHFQGSGQSYQLEQVKQLLSGLSYMARKKRMHADIKPANFLMKADGSIVFGDWGGARTMKKNNNEKVQTFEQIAHTPHFVPLEDTGKIADAAEEFNNQTKEVTSAEKVLEIAKQKLEGATTKKAKNLARTEIQTAKQTLKASVKKREKLREKYLDYRQKLDTYATGAALHQILTGQDHLKPDQYMKGNKDYPKPDVENFTFDRSALIEAGWEGTGVIELVEKMVHPDPDKRISPKEAAKLAELLSLPPEWVI